jgi:hypothetical protein
VYNQPAAMHAAPRGTSHQLTATASARPAAAATAYDVIAARLTAAGGASPAATSRTGPTRTSSVPRTPSL